jgi:hypothetical protein
MSRSGPRLQMQKSPRTLARVAPLVWRCRTHLGRRPCHRLERVRLQKLLHPRGRSRPRRMVRSPRTLAGRRSDRPRAGQWRAVLRGTSRPVGHLGPSLAHITLDSLDGAVVRIGPLAFGIRELEREMCRLDRGTGQLPLMTARGLIQRLLNRASQVGNAIRTPPRSSYPGRVLRPDRRVRRLLQQV